MSQTTLHPFIERIDTDTFPAAFRFSKNSSPDQLVEFFNTSREEIEELLHTAGAVLFSGVAIDSRQVFEDCMKKLGKRFINYADGNSPRTKLSEFVYTSTEYDPAKSITQHNELSYSANWPSKIFFSCIRAAETGGETPLADGREVLKRIDPYVVDKIKAEGVIYYRNLHGGEGMGPSWQDTFETKSEQAAEEFCKNSRMDYEWKSDGSIRLIQKRKGIIEHPVTGEEVWFNQMDQFHPIHMGEEIYSVLMTMYEPDELPTYVTYGDGTPVAKETIDDIKKVFDEVSVARPWQNGDLVLVDNVLVSHGRRPFTGERQILVAMME